MADKKVVEQYYTRPPKLSGWESFSIFLWNGETSQFMGRTAGSWAKILLFYLIFYAALAGFFAGLMGVFWQTLDEKIPRRKLKDSLIGTDPGLGFRPMPPGANLGSTLIWYKASDPQNLVHWYNKSNEFLDTYKKTNETNLINCGYGKQREADKICRFSADDLDKCSPRHTEGRFGYPEKKPCVFLKLNKIYEWEPVVYTNLSDAALPKAMPQNLREHIRQVPKEKLNTVWISCEGENPADVENLGAISYYPQKGFPAYYFPYLNKEGYLPPIVAVQFENPRSGVLINIECKAWAENIKLDRADRKGSVHFELLIDE